MTPRDRPPLFRTDSEAVTAAALPILTELRARGLDHRWVRAWRSSQAFALNLFAGLNAAAVTELLSRCTSAEPGTITSVLPPDFEYSDPQDRLAESSAPRPHRTQIDVRLDGSSDNGRRYTALVEVKFTEDDFGHCSAYDSPANTHRHICHQAGPFGGDPDACFQLSNHGHGRRRYDQYLASAPVGDVDQRIAGTGCWFRSSLSQPMRNLALAHALLDSGETDQVAFAVCAPSGHKTVWRRLAELRHIYPDIANRYICGLTAEDVAALHDDHGQELKRRYPPPALSPM